MLYIYLTIILSPLIGSLLAGFFGKILGNTFAHLVAIFSVAISFVLSIFVFYQHIIAKYSSFNSNLYTWLEINDFNLSIGLLIDELTVIMMLIVTFVSLMVHIYTVGYMKGEKNYSRFFSYIALFTFAMLVLIMSNNLLQLFFGWEAVGLVSYLLIGFYHTKDSAVNASFKAFVVNRVGDLGLFLAIALIYVNFHTLDYADIFVQLKNISHLELFNIDLISVICLLLFVGAMGKSAQVPLHVWLPGSMEGPTPISALIHAATMVTAGIFMVSRLSPMFELSDIALNFIVIIGSITALFMGLVALVQNDIKKIIAYSTLSQLGYMTVALGVSSYSVAIFHLLTHAFFKALLFLAAGSVIVALHHQQDIRQMGNLRKKMPITHYSFIIGTLAIIGFPGFAGFYSKDMIIEAVHFSNLAAANFAYYAVIIGVFVTSLYSMRLLFLVFYGKVKNEKLHNHAKESPMSITIPLILLAIPSFIIGFIVIKPILFSKVLDGALVVDEAHKSMELLAHHFNSAFIMTTNAIFSLPFWLMIFGIIVAWVLFIYKVGLSNIVAQKLSLIYIILKNLYGFDKLNNFIFVRGTKFIANLFSNFDWNFIDKILVDGVAKISLIFGKIIRLSQTGFVYHYGFFMIITLVVMLFWIML